jgi:hypothetical protein
MAGFANIEVLDSDSGLNAYSKVGKQRGLLWGVSPGTRIGAGGVIASRCGGARDRP